MAVKERNLIKIKTIATSHAKQISVVNYGKTEGSLFKEIALATHPEHGDVRITEIHGWVNGMTLAKAGVEDVRANGQLYWLISHRDQLYWFVAPVKGEAYDYYVKQKRLDQLFI